MSYSLGPILCKRNYLISLRFPQKSLINFAKLKFLNDKSYSYTKKNGTWCLVNFIIQKLKFYKIAQVFFVNFSGARKFERFDRLFFFRKSLCFPFHLLERGHREISISTTKPTNSLPNADD